MANSKKIIDLFCGAGGLSLGAARAGFHVIGAVDVDPIAIAAHKKNFPNTIHTEIDVSKADEKLLHVFGIKKQELCGIIGGPPCQGFSAIGKLDDTDPRNLLFVDFFRLVSLMKPIFFLCENVPGLLRKKYSTVRERALAYLPDYKILPALLLNASDFGAPTSRTRAFFVGYRSDISLSLDQSCFRPSSDIKKIKVKEALKGLPKKINPNWKTHTDWLSMRDGFDGFFFERLRGIVPQNTGDPYALKMLSEHKKVSGCIGTLHSEEMINRFQSIAPGVGDKISRSRRLQPNGFCPTLRAGTGREHGSFQAVRPIHYSEDRVITPREAVRLQGFPDWFQFNSTKWHSFRLIGNSVSPILAEHIFSVIYEALVVNTEEK